MKILYMALLASSVGIASTVELVITEDELQTSIEESVVDPCVTSVEVDILSGKVILSATRERPMNGIEDEMSMEIYLDEVDGHLSITIGNAILNGLDIGENRLAVWNDRIERGFLRLTGNLQGTLESVTIGSSRIVLVWE
jgi:hypothetical protein